MKHPHTKKHKAQPKIEYHSKGSGRILRGEKEIKAYEQYVQGNS